MLCTEHYLRLDQFITERGNANLIQNVKFYCILVTFLNRISFMSAMSALNALRDFVALCSFKINIIAKIKYYVVVELRTIFYLDLCYKIRTG